MRKFTLLVAAAIMAICANAQTETVAFGKADNASAKDLEVSGPCFKIDGTYIAGGTSKVNVYDGDSGIKCRTNKTDDTLILTVDEGCMITKLTMGMVTNASKSVIIESISIDDTPIANFTPITTPNINESPTGEAVVNLDNIKATKSIAFHFGYPADFEGNKQVFIAGEVTFEKGLAGIVNVNAAEENAPIYNLQGVQVDENYKGIVIKNGKKYINK